MSPWPLLIAGGVALAGLSGCHYAVPDVKDAPLLPTYTRDVAPILRDHCVLCHGVPSDRGAPRDFRLDVFEDSGTVPGASSMAGDIVIEVESDVMPPAAAWGDGLGPNAKTVLRRWLDAGAPL